MAKVKESQPAPGMEPPSRPKIPKIAIDATVTTALATLEPKLSA
jgi:hypothetical protein